MIEVKATKNEKGVAVESHMDGMGIELLAESVGLINGLIDHFEKCNLSMEFILMATSAMAEFANKKMDRDDEDDEDNESPIDFDLFDKFIKEGGDFA